MVNVTRFLAAAQTLLEVGVLFGATPVHAQELPDPVRIIVPFSAGGTLDATARLLADSLRAATGRNNLVENRPGAAGTIAESDVAKAKPDGSMLLYTTGGHTTNAVLYSRLPFDPITDFTPITQLSVSAGFVLLVASTSPYKTAQDLIAAARAQPGKLTYGSAGNGNTTHIVGALFARAAGLDVVHVPYKASPLNDLMGGHIDLTFLSASLARPLLQQGKLRALAISGGQRAADLPDAPTFAELGIEGVDVPAWSGILGPRGMTAATAAMIQRDIAAATAKPEFQAAMLKFGSTAVVSTPAEFAAYIRTEVQRYKKQLPPLGIRMD